LPYGTDVGPLQVPMSWLVPRGINRILQISTLVYYQVLLI
jgi:hypothetical protein